jgi:asparagine synthetase B (glutamine-hydrolysing)
MINLLSVPPIYLDGKNHNFQLPPILDFPRGLYANAIEENSGDLLIWRDPLGAHKIFYGRAIDKQWVIANRIDELTAAGISLNDIRACPGGALIRANDQGYTVVNSYHPHNLPEDDSLNGQNLFIKVDERLSIAFQSLAKSYPKATFSVCLSGGLDSTIIAYYAKKYLPNITAFSFSFADEAESLSELNEVSLSDDFLSAKKIAKALEIKLVPVTRPRASVMDSISKAVSLGQDSRDFNAHCALINLFLAESIRDYFPDGQVIVLTGDLMNEFVCDYKEELIDGAIYYPQPKISLARRRRFFTKGLEAGDREVGVFNSFGLILAQPYAAVVDLFMQLPIKELEQFNAKVALNGSLLPDHILKQLSLAKTRAQVGGKDGGVLGICHRHGITQDRLLSMWQSYFPGESMESIKSLIQVGSYRY